MNFEKQPAVPHELEDKDSEKFEAELRAQQAEKAIAFLRKIDAEQVFRSEETRRKFIQGLDYEEFKLFLERINGLLRDKKIKDREADGNEVYLESMFGSDVPPEQEDKEMILRETFSHAKSINALDRTALLLGLAINKLHLFADGNGRTSRFVFHMLVKGYEDNPEDNEQIKKLLGTDGRKVIDISPGLLKRRITEFLEKRELEKTNIDELFHIEGVRNTEQMSYQPDVTEENKTSFILMLGRSYQDYARLALLRFISKHDRLDEVVEVPGSRIRVENELTGEVETKQLMNQAIKLSSFIPTLSNGDVEQILSHYREIRADNARTMLDCIVHPDQYPFRDESGWNDYSNLCEYFEYEIKRRNKKYFG